LRIVILPELDVPLRMMIVLYTVPGAVCD
jgi:hypothetical protein